MGLLNSLQKQFAQLEMSTHLYLLHPTQDQLSSSFSKFSSDCSYHSNKNTKIIFFKKNKKITKKVVNHQWHKPPSPIPLEFLT